MASKDQALRRWEYGYYLDVQTRWLDNDQYGHLNNSAYYLIADSVNNTYLADHCGIVPYQQPSQHAGASASQKNTQAARDAIGLVIGSNAQFFAPTSFPNTLRVGLRVANLGSSSVTYEFGFFELPAHQQGSSSLSSDYDPSKRTLSPEALAAVIVRVTHVFVDRTTRRPLKPMPNVIRDGLARLLVERSKGVSSKL